MEVNYTLECTYSDFLVEASMTTRHVDVDWLEKAALYLLRHQSLQAERRKTVEEIVKKLGLRVKI